MSDPMRRASRGPLLSSLLAAAALALPGWPGSATAQKGLADGPLIRVDTRVFDFGQVEQANHYSHKFNVSNGGTKPLRITELEVSCGCTAALASDSLLAPGESTVIEITFSSKDFEGEQIKGVTVHSNDPMEPRLELHVKADVKPFVRVAERLLDFGLIRRGETKTLSAEFAADAGTGFAVKSVEGGEEWVTWKITPLPGTSEARVRVEATTRPGAPLGRFQKRAQLALTHPHRSHETLDVRGMVYSYFVVEKPTVNFLPVKPGKVTTKTVEISSDGSRPYTLVSATSSSSKFSATLEEKSPQLTLVHLEFRAPSEAGKIHETVTIATTDPDDKELVLKVNATVRP